MASASKAAPRHTRHDSLCAEWSCQQSLASADAAALGSSSTPLTGTQKVSAWLHAFPLLPLQIQGLGSGQGCQRTAIPRQHKTARDAAVERNCVGRQERRALGAALACTAASAEFRARCAQKGLCPSGEPLRLCRHVARSAVLSAQHSDTRPRVTLYIKLRVSHLSPPHSAPLPRACARLARRTQPLCRSRLMILSSLLRMVGYSVRRMLPC